MLPIRSMFWVHRVHKQTTMIQHAAHTNDGVLFGNVATRVYSEQSRHVPVLYLTLEQVAEFPPPLHNKLRS